MPRRKTNRTKSSSTPLSTRKLTTVECIELLGTVRAITEATVSLMDLDTARALQREMKFTLDFAPIFIPSWYIENKHNIDKYQALIDAFVKFRIELEGIGVTIMVNEISEGAKHADS